MEKNHKQYRWTLWLAALVIVLLAWYGLSRLKAAEGIKAIENTGYYHESVRGTVVSYTETETGVLVGIEDQADFRGRIVQTVFVSDRTVFENEELRRQIDQKETGIVIWVSSEYLGQTFGGIYPADYVNQLP